MANYLGLVNDVLVKLREPQVTSVSDNTYSALIGSLVNDAKREVEEAWQWSHLQDSFSSNFTVANAGVVPFSGVVCNLSGAAPRIRAQIWQDLSTSSYIVRHDTVGFASLLDQTQYADANSFVQRKAAADASFGTIPSSFFMTRAQATPTAAPTLVINCFPLPDKTYPFTVVIKNPQSSLSADTDVLFVPQAPVIMRAYLFALYERGEELGEALTLTSVKADLALSDAISDDTVTQRGLQLVCE